MTSLEPEPVADVAEFAPFPLDRFLTEKALWAANYFVLWPLGLALTVNVEIMDGLVVKAENLHVREWTAPVGDRETIDQAPAENAADRKSFYEFVLERLSEMKPEERDLARARLEQNISISLPEAEA
jgi:hypothetical protein